MMRFVFLFLLAPVGILTINNGLGLTPQMGWNSWNHFACGINQTLIHNTIDAMISTKLSQAGYNYVNMDDCWAGWRDGEGKIQPDNKTFPDGIKPLAQHAHRLGLKFGLYSDAGVKTCAGRPGSLGYEKNDADSYSSWQVDYLKYDNCFNKGIPPTKRYPPMRDALNASGRDIFFSMCEWGRDNPATWAPDVGNSWRTTPDIRDDWNAILNRIDLNNRWWKYAAPGGWNDPDMLEVGNGGCSDVEYQSHFFLWAISKAPLLVGCDITKMSQSTFDILTAPEVIAVNQDSLGEQAHKLHITVMPGSGVLQRVKKSVDGIGAVSLVGADCLESTSSSIHLQQWKGGEDNTIQSDVIERDGSQWCIDIDGCGTTPGTLVEGYPCHVGVGCTDGANQQWAFDETNESPQQIVSKMDGSCLTYDKDTLLVTTEKCTHASSQLWKYDTTNHQLEAQGSVGTCLTVMPSEDLEVWGGKLSGGTYVALLLNRASTTEKITLSWDDLGIDKDQSCNVRNLWLRKDLGTHKESFTATVPSHASVILKLSPNTSSQ